MGTTTSNFNLIKPAGEDFYNIADANSNMDIIDAELKKLSDTGEASKVSITKLQTDTQSNSSNINSISELISSGAVQTPRLTLGANKISIQDVPVSPRIEFTGISYVNLLGKDGDCEDVSRWDATYAVNMIDTGSKAFGKSSFKVSIQGTKGYGFIGKILPIEDGKYYMLSAYMKNGNASEVHINLGGYGGTPIVTQTSSMQRVCGKWHATSSANMSFNMVVVGTDGQYGYFDGLMLTEIPESDYALPDAELMAKYPYVESYGVLTNPYFENRRYNLVRNGNCEEGIGYWRSSDTATTSMTIENGRFKIISNVKYGFFYQVIKVKPNTVYSIFANTSGNGVLYVDNIDFNTIIANNKSTFNTGANSEILILLHGGATAGTSYFDSIMLVEGSTVPAEYKACDLQRFVVEGQFTQDDKVVIEDGKVSGVLNWKHKTLYGKDWSPAFATYPSGYKVITFQKLTNLIDSDSAICVVKYNGNIIDRVSTWSGGDQIEIDPNYLALSINNTDSGWNNTINPNDDEVKAFMNGWQAISNDNTSRYILWRSVLSTSTSDKKVYPTGTAALSTAYANAGATVIYVDDVAPFKVGDRVFPIGQGVYSITAVSSNSITINTGLSLAVTSGAIIARADITGTDSRIINYCKNNLAPDYDGYRIHYKLANPEFITDTNVQVKGDIWELVRGDNYVYVDSGIVLNEVANPTLINTKYYINRNASTDDPNYSANSQLRNQVEQFFGQYKNGAYDNNWTVDTIVPYGKVRLISSQVNYDTNATYTIDYQILKPLHAQRFNSIAMSYTQGIIETLEGHSKTLEQKQQQDSTLDTLISSSIYEKGYMNSWVRFSQHTLGAYHTLTVFMLPKKVIPIINVSNIILNVRDSAGNAISAVNSASITFSAISNMFRFSIVITDSVLSGYAKDYGCAIAFDWTADCRGRI